MTLSGAGAGAGAVTGAVAWLAPLLLGAIGASNAQAEPAEPAQAKPAQAEPAQAEPAQAEPAQAEPAQAEPAQAKPAQAEPAQAEPAQTRAVVAANLEATGLQGPVLPERLLPPRASYFRVGVGAERFGNGFSGSDYMLALSVLYRNRAFGPNASLLAKPYFGTQGYEESRFLLGLGLRGYSQLLGHDVAYGVGVHGELRFEDHFWLLQVTPVELSAVVYRKRSFEIELSLGVRGAITGALIDSYLLDPNGFKNEVAQQQLDRETGDERMRAFLRVIFSRRVY